MDEKEISMEVVNLHAAGIDVGSRSHWVAVGQRNKTLGSLVFLTRIFLKWPIG